MHLPNQQRDQKIQKMGRYWLTVPIILILLAYAALVAARPAPIPMNDSLRYMIVGLNLETHGVFSSQPFDPDTKPEPTNIFGGPLVAYEIAGALAISPSARDSFICILSKRAVLEPCTTDLAVFQFIHWIQISIFLLCIGAVAQLFTNDARVALASMACALLCEELVEYSDKILTEPLFLAFVGLFLVSWTWAFLKRPELPVAWILAGVSLGLTILTKPAAQIIWMMSPFFFAGAVLVGKISLRHAIIGITLLSVASSVTIAPWMLRTYLQATELVISDRAYLYTTFAHRVGFNGMSWAQFATGWIYYFPDFGDDLARALFGKHAVEPLAWGPDSFYEHGNNVILPELVSHAQGGSVTELVLQEHVLNQPLKHAAVTALLFWRGFFVGKYFALASLLALGFLFYNKRFRWGFATILVPLCAMAFVHAAVSVGIVRYNIGLILPFSIALGIVLVSLYSKLRTRVQIPLLDRS